MQFFNLHSYLRYKILTEISCVDFLGKNKRFELNYILLSIDFNSRVIISVDLGPKDIMPSMCKIFKGSD
jgi:NADH:ubiquinone oxidoreductase subunit C